MFYFSQPTKSTGDILYFILLLCRGTHAASPQHDCVKDMNNIMLTHRMSGYHLLSVSCGSYECWVWFKLKQHHNNFYVGSEWLAVNIFVTAVYIFWAELCKVLIILIWCLNTTYIDFPATFLLFVDIPKNILLD